MTHSRQINKFLRHQRTNQLHFDIAQNVVGHIEISIESDVGQYPDSSTSL